MINIAPKPDRREQARQAAFEWMRAVLQKEISLDALRREIGDVPDIAALLDRLYDGRLSDRNRSMAVLANCHGLSGGTVCEFLGIDKKTYRKYLRTFKNGGQAALFARQTKSTRKFDNEAVKQAVFRILHEPPSNYGINRTTWIMPDLSRVLRETGQPACPEVIRKITKAAGYRWRKARKVLTSTDPEYREKVRHIQSILAELQENQAFFSIDEFGPFSFGSGRQNAGLPRQMPTVPQRQKSKGSLIMTSALELSRNQMTYFYSPRKDTGEMLRMLLPYSMSTTTRPKFISLGMRRRGICPRCYMLMSLSITKPSLRETWPGRSSIWHRYPLARSFSTSSRACSVGWRARSSLTATMGR